jgi:hypothetical protein
LRKKNASGSLRPNAPRRNGRQRIEQGRIDRLLRDAAFQQAGEIRKYVEVMHDLPSDFAED